MTRKVAVAAVIAVTLIVAALAASTVASAAAEARAVENGQRFGPLTLYVMCVELLVDADDVDDKVWRVYFGYAATDDVLPEQVEKSEFEDAPGWHVVGGSEPGSFEDTGFGDTGGDVVAAIVVENEPGYGAESIVWDVDLDGPHDFGPAKARFDGEDMGPAECEEGTIGADVVEGNTPAGEEGTEPQGPVRAIYCSVEGNTVNGAAIAPGTALNLTLGQPARDPRYKGATPAFFVEGIGATCDPPPAGYTVKGLVDGAGVAHGLENAIYPFYEQA